MPLTVRPADGLIHRLLQQNSQPAGKPQAEEPSPVHANDQVSISQHAREQAGVVDSRQQNQSKLESQLLRLYTHHGFAEGEK